MMTNITNILDDATIKRFGETPIQYDGKEQITPIYKVITTQKDMFFECPFEWAPNGLDFWATIINFGGLRFTAMGSKGSWFRQKFTPDEIKSARLLIESYFLRGGGKTDFPLKDPKCHCLGVRYAADWIVEKT
jgi:hypothetical protein